MLEIETRLSISFHTQTDKQTEWMNQELEKYLRFFIEYGQRNWPEQPATTEFAVNNKVHLATKILLFIANYDKELRIGADIRRKEKVEKVTKFVEKIRKV